ncbi:MAG: acyltransferase, partial [Pseudomonadota bacterium]
DGIRVKVFCAMSGLVIFIMLSRSSQPYFTYISRRCLRIFPAYLVLLFVSVLLVDFSINALVTNPLQTEGNMRRLAILENSKAYFWPHIAAHITMLHTLVPEEILPAAPYAFLGQAWNLTYEWLFYLCAPFAFWMLTKQPKWVIPILIAYTVLYFVTRSGFYLPADTAEYSVWFVIGMLSFYLLINIEKIPFRFNNLHALILGGLLFFITGQFATTVWAGLLISILARVQNKDEGNLVCKFLVTKPLKYLGKISYSIYLTHMVALYFAMWVLNHVDLPIYIYALVMMSMTFAGTWILSELLFTYVEQPAIEFGRTATIRQIPKSAIQPNSE